MSGRDPDRVLVASERVYRILLSAYPKEFREAYGSQMEQAYRDLCREELDRAGTSGILGLWGRTLLDLVTSAFAERRSGLGRASSEEATSRDRRLAWIGSVLLLAPLFFVAASLLKYGLGAGILFDPLESAFLSDPQRRGCSTRCHRSCSSAGCAWRWRSTRSPYSDCV